MNYFEYEEKAATTACYNEKVALSYVTLGLCSEMGETYEKINNEAETEEISKEIGDMFWYLAMIRKECNLDIEGWDWKEALTNAEGAGVFDLPVEVGKIADQVKKWLRDDWKEAEQNVFPEARKKAVLEAWKNAWKVINSMINRVGLDTEKIAEQNIENCFRVNNATKFMEQETTDEKL